MKKVVLLLTAILMVSTLGAAKRRVPKAPDFKLPGVNGDTVHLYDYKGKVVILDFWATWCPPCKAEIPGFIELMKKLKDKPFTVIGVALDDPKRVDAFYKKYKMNYPVAYGDRQIARLYGGIRGIPTTFILDKDMRIVKKFVGYRSKEIFLQTVEQLLNE